jgi:hypothetical protein
MVNKTQFYQTKVCIAVKRALSEPYFYSVKNEDGYLD